MSTEARPLDLASLTAAVNDAAAIRRVARLVPVDGGKVFPPTYEGGQYALEDRVIAGERVPCVILDSVQSQANRMELALLEAHREGAIAIPLVEVDFDRAGVPEVGKLTSLEAPHRYADAILRDSFHGQVPFRQSPEGRVLDTASTANATGLFEHCPTALIFGLWDSSGPRGGLGTKFARTLVSEIVGVNVARGVRPSSRIDPLGIRKEAGPVYAGADGTITLDESKAKKSGKAAQKYGKKGDPSEANHGNVTPSLSNDKGVPHHGGVTLDYAMQSFVLSLPGIRRLRFPGANGTVDRERDSAARTALAALALCGAALSVIRGVDLRSRCLLVPDAAHPTSWEVVRSDGTSDRFLLDPAGACDLLRDAVAKARAAGLPWREETLVLTPSEGLAALVKKSRELALVESEA